MLTITIAVVRVDVELESLLRNACAIADGNGEAKQLVGLVALGYIRARSEKQMVIPPGVNLVSREESSCSSCSTAELSLAERSPDPIQEHQPIAFIRSKALFLPQNKNEKTIC
jgi:hypothetical protein